MKWSLFLCLLLVCIPFTGSAQLGAPPSGVRIEVSPRFPAPGQTVTAAINDYATDTNGATIRWFADGTELTSVQNQRNLTLTAGSIGVVTDLRVQIDLRTGGSITASQKITVSDIDLTIDAKTLIPAFYQGRALPSIGSTVQVVAIPKLGNTKSAAAYSYTWRLDNKVVQGGALKGGYVSTFAMPTGRGANLVVDVSDETGATVASKSIFIPNHEPELLFYADNPLRGLSRITIPKNYRLLAGEVTLRAEPYFMDVAILNKNPHLEWKVDGRTIQNPSEDKQTITLQNAGGSGNFKVEFHLRNLQQLLQGVRDDFNIQF